MNVITRGGQYYLDLSSQEREAFRQYYKRNSAVYQTALQLFDGDSSDAPEWFMSLRNYVEDLSLTHSLIITNEFDSFSEIQDTVRRLTAFFKEMRQS